MVYPDGDDVLVRQEHPNVVYLLGTFSAPDQFMLRTRHEAVSQALAFAQHRRVRAWFARDDNDFVLLGTFNMTEPGTPS